MELGVIMMGTEAPLASLAKLMPLLLTRRPGGIARAPAGHSNFSKFL